MSIPTREAVFMWDSSGLNVAIPKQRGSGYLKVPLGHHVVEALSDIETDERIDLCGLDGYLWLNYGYVYKEGEREAIEARVLPRLASHFKFSTWREDDNEFWRIVQSQA